MSASRRVPPLRPGRRPPNYRPALTILAMTILAAGAVVLLRPPRAEVQPSPTPTVIVSPSPSPSASPSVPPSLPA